MKRKHLAYTSLGVLSALALAPVIGARAQTLSAQDLSVLVQSTASDTDSALLYIPGSNDPSASVVPKTTFSYDATGDDSSWSGALSGTLVNSFALNYASSGDSATSNTWTSSGSLSGIGSVSGFGNASVTYPTSTTFDVAFSDTLSAGGNTYTVSGSIPGTFNPDGSYNFGPPLEVSSNPVQYSGSGSPAYVRVFKWSYDRRYPADVSDLWGIPIERTLILTERARRAGAAEMIITDGDDGILAPVDDVEALVAVLEPLMREPERIEAIGERARARVVSAFSRDREADEISAVYRQVWAMRKS
jgi:hypothetical protein